MWIYEKKLQFPVKIKNPNPKMAQVILSQYGGPDGELGASLRYLSQRFSMPTEITKATFKPMCFLNILCPSFKIVNAENKV